MTDRVRQNRIVDLAPIVAILGDLLAGFFAQTLAFWVRFRSGWIPYDVRWWRVAGDPSATEFGGYWQHFIPGAVLLVALLVRQGLYQRRAIVRAHQYGWAVAKVSGLWVALYLGLSLFLRLSPSVSRVYVIIAGGLLVGVLYGWRRAYGAWLLRSRFADAFRQKVLLVGWSESAGRLGGQGADGGIADEAREIEVVGCVPVPGGAVQPPENLRRLGQLEDLGTLLQSERIDVVLLADTSVSNSQVIALIDQCEQRHVAFKVLPSYFQIMVSCLEMEVWNGVPLFGVANLPLNRLTNRCLKRAMDVAGALVGLAVFAPVMAFAAWRIRRESPGPVLFRQSRVGLYGREFTMLKLRSMKLDSELADHASQSTLRDDPRLLRIGKMLRKWNIDELPQFWNVLVGDMSLVGPRPERSYHSDLLSRQIPHYSARYSSKPGMTGWAQVNGWRGDTDLVQRIECDLWYLEHWSLWLDLTIMFRTLFQYRNAY